MVRRRPGKRVKTKRGVAQQRWELAAKVKGGVLVEQEVSEGRRQAFEWSVLLVLGVFGIYKTWALFGVIPVPNPDYSGFVRVGEQLLHFELPTSFKRAPVLGVLQVGLSHFVWWGPHPTLTASWLLNAVFSVLNIILVWRVGRMLVGESAIWLALVFGLNPWVLRYQIAPIAETALIFFSLTSLFFIFRRSKWGYVFAAVASLVRYEGVALIVVAFLMDMVEGRGRRERLYALLWAFLASVPFLFWMLGTVLTWGTSSQSHYVRNYEAFFTGKGAHGSGYLRFFQLLWQSSVEVLFKLPGYAKAMVVRPTSQAEADAMTLSVNQMNVWFGLSKVIAGLSCLMAFAYGIYKRHWKLLGLILFTLLYISVHSLRIKSHLRYTVPGIWMTLMICWVGFQCWGRLINFRGWLPKNVVVVFQVLVFIVSSIVLVGLLRYLGDARATCPFTAWLGYVGLAVVVLIMVLRLWFFKFRRIGMHMAIASVVGLAVLSQHYTTATVIRYGTYNKEFKQLVDWYVANAKPGEKLVCTWSSLLKLLGERYKDSFISFGSIKGETFEEFIENCYKADVTYVTWNIRGSFNKMRKGLGHIGSQLHDPQDTGPFELVARIERDKINRWINIFRLREKPEAANP